MPPTTRWLPLPLTPTPTPNPYPYTRYEDAAYYTLALRYLRSLTTADTKGDTYSELPVYEEQLRQLLCYYRGTRVLHGYGRFRLEVSPNPNPTPNPNPNPYPNPKPNPNPNPTPHPHPTPPPYP